MFKYIKLVIKSYVEIIYQVLKDEEDFVGGITDLLFIKGSIKFNICVFLPLPLLYCWQLVHYISMQCNFSPFLHLSMNYSHLQAQMFYGTKEINRDTNRHKVNWANMKLACFSQTNKFSMLLSSPSQSSICCIQFSMSRIYRSNILCFYLSFFFIFCSPNSMPLIITMKIILFNSVHSFDKSFMTQTNKQKCFKCTIRESLIMKNKSYESSLLISTLI